MSDCSKHKKDVAGISDMKVLAEMIGDLHYESLAELFSELSTKIYKDGMRDWNNGRENLGICLEMCSSNIAAAAVKINKAWQISKPFMEKT